MQVGSQPFAAGMNILGAHIDSPRLDLKQNPLYESNGFALMDTHYYGGIKNYQWVTLPLALHGVVAKTDGTVVAMTVAFGAVLGMLVEGNTLDASISAKLMARVNSGALPFHTVTVGNLQAPRPGAAEAPTVGRFPSPDALLTQSSIARAARDPDVRIEPAWKASLVYGMPCAVYHQFPAAYYLAARFADDFEAAVLHAVNGGGQNLARAMLTGALVGAQVGLSGIPQRFIDGLAQSDALSAIVQRVAGSA